ncbi:MAG TPA: hypothetical protein ENJ00_08520 [Phycisphaerales bacterium]|nr:hypothetical protein [Phycisphaerales bacterium]
MMIETELAGAVAQMGAAGLIGLMWLSERRAAHDRERQLSEVHDRIKADKVELGVLLSALEANTRALVSLESGQARLVSVIEKMDQRERSAESGIVKP